MLNLLDLWILFFYCKLANLLACSSKRHSTCSASSIMLSTRTFGPKHSIFLNLQSLTLPSYTTGECIQQSQVILSKKIHRSLNYVSKKKKNVGIEAAKTAVTIRTESSVFNSIMFESIKHCLVINIPKLYLNLWR